MVEMFTTARRTFSQHRRQAGQRLAIHPGGQQGVDGAGQPEEEQKAGAEEGRGGILDSMVPFCREGSPNKVGTYPGI